MSLSCSPPWTSILRARHFLRPLELPVRARLLERGVVRVLEPPPHRDRDVRRVAAVGVGKKLDVRSHSLTYGWNDRFAPSRCGVAIAPTGGAKADLEGFAADLIADPREPRRLVRGCDVPTHARPVRRQRPHRSAEQDRHRLARDLAVKIPERRVDARERATEERPRELQLRVDHRVVD